MTGQPSIWYEACDPDANEGRMGIMNCTAGGPPFTPLPALEAAKTLHTVLRNDGLAPGSPVSPAKGLRFVRRLPVFQSSNMDSDDDWVLLYHSDAGDVLLAAWTSSTFEHVLRIPGVEEGVCFSQIGMLGEPLPELCHDHRGLHVNVSDAPKYLVKKKPAAASMQHDDQQGSLVKKKPAVMKQDDDQHGRRPTDRASRWVSQRATPPSDPVTIVPGPYTVSFERANNHSGTPQVNFAIFGYILTSF